MPRSQWQLQYLSWFLNARAQHECNLERRGYSDLWSGQRVW